MLLSLLSVPFICFSVFDSLLLLNVCGSIQFDVVSIGYVNHSLIHL